MTVMKYSFLTHFLVSAGHAANYSVRLETWWCTTWEVYKTVPGYRMGVYSSFLDILGGFHLGSTITFACIFGIWARKKHNLLLHSKFSLLSTQRNCAGNNRNKTSRLSALFCTKNHRNPFTNLRERVQWRCHASSKKVQKLKTRVLVMYGCMRIIHP